MISRREWLGRSLGAGATLALTPELLRALQASQLQGGTLLQRAIPSTGEMLPVIGLTFANHPSCADHAALKEVLRTLVDGGGRVVDSMNVTTPATEEFPGTIANELGVQNKIFWSMRGAPPGAPQPGPAVVTAHIETLLATLKVPRIDLLMVNAGGDPTQWDALKTAKREGRVRYIGLQALGGPMNTQLEAMMRKEPIDFIGVRYAVDFREVEQTILPLAQERKIGVLGYFPFGGANGLSCASERGLFARVTNTPLPEWAAEFEAKTWAQFFLKYVVSHPAVTAVRPGTTKATHMLDNIAGGIGRLPNETTRKRMAAFIDALPTAAPQVPQQAAPAQPPGIALPLAVLDRYVGEYKATSGFTMTFRRDGATLLVKPGTNPEVSLIARSATRFSDPRGPAMEFQLDGQGKVTGLILEQGNQRIPLERK